MELDKESLKRRYEWLSDEALFAIDRNELAGDVRRIYDAEVARRNSISA